MNKTIRVKNKVTKEDIKELYKKLEDYEIVEYENYYAPAGITLEQFKKVRYIKFKEAQEIHKAHLKEIDKMRKIRAKIIKEPIMDGLGLVSIKHPQNIKKRKKPKRSIK